MVFISTQILLIYPDSFVRRVEWKAGKESKAHILNCIVFFIKEIENEAIV
jgi:hypothetical protein